MGLVKRFEVHLIALDPTQGSEIRKTRPCVIVSPDELHYLRTVIIAPMTTKGRRYPFRVPVTFQGKRGSIVLDQLRTVDRSRLLQRLGKVSAKTGAKMLALLREMFSE